MKQVAGILAIGIGIVFITSSIMTLTVSSAQSSAPRLTCGPHSTLVYPGYTSRSELTALFPRSAADIADLMAGERERLTNLLSEFLSVPAEERTYDNTMRVFDCAYAWFVHTSSRIRIIEMVHEESALRDRACTAGVEWSAFALDLFDRPEVHQAFCAYKTMGRDGAFLSSSQQYLLEESIASGVRNGLDLPPEALAHVRDLKKKIQELSSDFSRAIASDASTIAVERGDLAGLSDDFIAGLERTDDGRYILGVDYPTYFQVMDHCVVSSTRQALYRIFNNRAYPHNRDVLNQLIELRDELARALSFESFAHYNLDDQMVQTPERARSFLREVWEKVLPLAAREIAHFSQELPPGITLTREGLLQPWDLPYVKEQYRQKHFALDDRVIAEYFPLPHTMRGLLQVYEQFFDLRLTVSPMNDLWTDEVHLVEVYRATPSGEQFLGSIILDLHPRPGKYSHACHVNIVPALESAGIRIPSASVVIANFPRPTASQPALLTHTDVTTFFHEFGHALHAVLGATEMAQHSGTRVKTDFVELPSQTFERWMWDTKILKLVSAHYITGEPLPDAMIDGLVSAQYFDAGTFYQRQCALAFLALELFGPGSQKDSDTISERAWSRFVPSIAPDRENHRHASFGHLTGYGAKYYGYLWSEVFAYDIFAQVEREGLLHAPAGQRLIQSILGRGGSADPNELLVEYLGRVPRIDAFMSAITGAL